MACSLIYVLEGVVTLPISASIVGVLLVGVLLDFPQSSERVCLTIAIQASHLLSFHHLLSMSQPSPPGLSSMTAMPTPSSNFKLVLETALKEYRNKTGQDLTAHPLTAQFQACDSPAAILAILQDQVDQFNQSRSSDERLQRWLSPAINVLHAFSETLGGGISLVNIIDLSEISF